MARQTLTEKIVTKGLVLRELQAQQAQAAVNFIAASAAAQATSDVAAVHASAVERAIGIITDAGVTL